MKKPGDCVHCGARLSPDLPEDACPYCLVLLALNPQTDPLGNYQILEQVARGGMGVVFRAHHAGLNRDVALKRIVNGWFASSEQVQRFFIEARAAARLEHPHIVRVYDVGEDNQGYFLAMEWLPRGTLAERLNKLSPRQAASLVARIARAVHFAHEHGVLHRDLKPSNILFDAEDEPHVADFGLAKLHDEDADLTESLSIIGSLHYLAPEVASGGTNHATISSDIYSLGTILYECLAGKTPFAAATPVEAIRRAAEEVPLPPSRFNCPPSGPARASSRPDHDLDTISLKCLAKSPAQRYPSAAALAEDLERWLRSEPITARPPTPAERILRWARKNPPLAAALLLLGVALLAGIAGVTWQWRRARRSEEQARLQLYAADMLAASRAMTEGDFGEARRLLDLYRPAPRSVDLRGFEWRCLNEATRGQELAVVGAYSNLVSRVAWSPDGRLLACGGRDDNVRLFDATNRNLLAQWPREQGFIWSLEFSGDGRTLLTAGDTGEVKLWDIPSRNLRQKFPGVTAAFLGHRIITSGARPVFWASPASVDLWEQDGTHLQQFTIQGKCVAISPGGRWLAITLQPRDVGIWDLESWTRIHTLHSPEEVWAPQFDPASRRLAACGHQKAFVWDLERPEPASILNGHYLKVWWCAFAPDGQSLATVGSDRSIRFWNTTNWLQSGEFRGHSDEIWCAAFHPDGQKLATVGKDGTVRVWPGKPENPPADIVHDEWVHPIFSADGSRLVTAVGNSTSHETLIWETTSRHLLAKLANASPLGFDSRDRLLLWRRTGGQIVLWKAGEEPGGQVIALNPSEQDSLPVQIGLSPGGQWCFGAGTNGLLTLFDVDSRRKAGALACPLPFWRAAACTRDGHLIAFSKEDVPLLWLADLKAGRLRELRGHRDMISGLAFAPDDRLLATGGADGKIMLWDVESGRPVRTLPGHLEDATDVSFSPDGQTLASVAYHDGVKLWHLATGREVASFAMPRASSMLQFSPDGRFLAMTLGALAPEQLKILSAPKPSP